VPTRELRLQSTICPSIGDRRVSTRALTVASALRLRARDEEQPLHWHPPQRDHQCQGGNRLDHAADKAGGRRLPGRESFDDLAFGRLGFGRRGLFEFLEKVELLAHAKSAEIVGVVARLVVGLFAEAARAHIFRSRRRHWRTHLVQREPVESVGRTINVIKDREQLR